MVSHHSPGWALLQPLQLQLLLPPSLLHARG
jgi:hypothetical protein